MKPAFQLLRSKKDPTLTRAQCTCSWRSPLGYHIEGRAKESWKAHFELRHTGLK